MSDEERSRWNRRYADGDHVPRSDPTPFVLEWLEHIPARRALDVATGTGRNALALAEAGFTVDAIDISEVAIHQARAEANRRDLDVNWVAADLDTEQLATSSYGLVTMVRYHNPGLWPRLEAALNPDGWILVEHHLRTTRTDVAGPPSDAFRLEPGELLTAFPRLRTVHYSEAVEPTVDGAAHVVLARLAACAGDPGW